jgi:hypothetical protein
MSQENVELHRDLAEAINRGDLGWLLAHADEELEFIPLRAGTEGSFRGPEGLRRYIEDTQESFDVFEISVDDVRAVGEKTVGWGTLRLRGPRRTALDSRRYLPSARGPSWVRGRACRRSSSSA